MMKACDYKNAKREVLIHGVFSMWVIGAFIPIVVTRDAYYPVSYTHLDVYKRQE